MYVIRLWEKDLYTNGKSFTPSLNHNSSYFVKFNFFYNLLKHVFCLLETTEIKFSTLNRLLMLSRMTEMAWIGYEFNWQWNETLREVIGKEKVVIVS